MTCTKEEIERKRLAALQKKQAKILNQNSSSLSCVTAPAPVPRSPGPGPIKGNVNNSQTFHPYLKSTNTNIPSSIIPATKVVSGTIYLISEDRFEVNPSDFCAPLINVFKSIPSKCYDPKSNLWNFSIEHYNELIEKVAPLAPHIVLGPLPAYVLKILREETMDPNIIDLAPIEKTLRDKLLTFQQEGVRFGIARRGRCMIADEMGLGKTFQALAIASYYRHDWPLLIVTTSSMRETWQQTISELLPSVPLVSVVTLSARKDALLVSDRQTEVVIVSFKTTTIHSDLLKSKKFGVVIIDESHNLKSRKAQCTRALAALCRAARRLVLLSGTPALSRPAELYTQLDMIAPGLFASYTEYGKRYCAGKQTSFGWDMSGQSHLAELGALLHRRFLIRRTKREVLALGEKIREVVMLDESLLVEGAAGGEALSSLAGSRGRGGTSQRRAALLALFAETARVKIPAVCEYVRRVCAEEACKFLVFAHHRGMLAALEDALAEARAPHVTIHGGTPPALRASLVERFQCSPASRCRCAVLALTAAGAGLSLTAARLVLFAELPWTPGALAQAEARAHRIGTDTGEGPVRVRYLLAARGTADSLLWPMLADKLHVLNDVGLTDDSFEGTASRDQKSQNKITQYLSPLKGFKNKNDYIPGTNIRKGSESGATTTSAENVLEDQSFLAALEEAMENEEAAEKHANKEDVDRSFLADEEGDELLANIDF